MSGPLSRNGAALGTRVRIVELGEQRGRIEIEYYSQTDPTGSFSKSPESTSRVPGWNLVVPVVGLEPTTYGL